MQETEKVRTSTLEFTVNVKTFNKEKGELVDAIVAGSKLTKADAGKIEANYKDMVIIEIEPSVNPCFVPDEDPCPNPNPNNGDCPKITITSVTKNN